jgi:hypothetical protein
MNATPLIEQDFVIKRSNSQNENDFFSNMGPNLLDIND